MSGNSLYENIIEWLKDKPSFVQDATRRLLQNAELTDIDKQELLKLLKKECGFSDIDLEYKPVSTSDIPKVIPNGEDFPKLISIKKPVNINALDTNAELNFQPSGITVVYGKNGSGKSSYSRILKRFCWSRHKDTRILPNVYISDDTKQSVIIETGSLNGQKTHKLNVLDQEPVPDLNSIYVFDSNCSSVHVNNETKTEYKPAEIDLIQNLIALLKELNVIIDKEISVLKTTKPDLSVQDFGTTEIYRWYSNIENETDENIIKIMDISVESQKRHADLILQLSKNNPNEENKELEQKKSRYATLKSELLKIEKAFSSHNFIHIQKIKEDYVAKKGAYEVSKSMIKKHDKLQGIGSESWRLLWSAAKKYAITEVHPENDDYPSNISGSVCVLCQQDLDEIAKSRLEDFNSFIKNNASEEFDQAEKVLKSKSTQIRDAQFSISIDTIDEIKQDTIGFAEQYEKFLLTFEQLKKNWYDYLKADKELEEVFISEYEENTNELNNHESPKIDNTTIVNNSQKVTLTKRLSLLSQVVSKKIEEINEKKEANLKLINNRSVLEKEKKELDALTYLISKKTEVLTYLDEYRLKSKLDDCLKKLNTGIYSKKIGDLLETSAIDLLRNEFISILKGFNSELATKVSLVKSRTASGTTFHKLGFATVNSSINSVLSEGEQKIISLSGFLAECTVDGSKNTLVFDDPVNSLDQDYRESIANKLIELCKERQIIVFTHDLYFLSLLMYGAKESLGKECQSVSLEFTDCSGVITDEVPFLAKNVQQRVDNIRTELDKLTLSATGKSAGLDSIRKKMRFLIEKSVEEILANKTIQRFSKNITVKEDALASYVVADKNDVDYLIKMYRKYSITEHDGGFETIPKLPDENIMKSDLGAFSTWKDRFKTKLDNYKKNGG